MNHRAAVAVALCLFVPIAAHAADTVRSLVTAANLPEMRWPDVSDYRRHLDAFYSARNDAFAWTRDGKPTSQALALAKLFAAADEKGVNAVDYDGDHWSPRIAELGTSDEALARFDVEMTATLMRYISDLHIGRVNPIRVAFFLDIKQKKYDLPQLVASLVDATDVAQQLDAVEPPYNGYRRLRDALNRYRALAAEGDAAPLPPLKILRPGGTWEGVPRLGELLRRLGDLDVAVEGTAYQGEIVEAVKRFQARHGFDADGTIGSVTLAALNTPASKRVEQIRLSMERWRWVPSEFIVWPIVVNIPEFRLRAYDSNQHAEVVMNVVVGKEFTSRQTPVFADTMKYLVFRPYWNVPPSIQRDEIMPKVKKDPSWLARNGYEMVDGAVRQKPGPNNALGNVKFMFPNPMNIYLHDTSARELFSRSRRAFSHGCIRVSNPAALAEWVLRDDPKWTPDAIAAAMTKGPIDAHVKVKRAIPVLIVYATAVAPEDGKVYFFDDIYGHDTTLMDALAHGYPYPD